MGAAEHRPAGRGCLFPFERFMKGLRSECKEVKRKEQTHPKEKNRGEAQQRGGGKIQASVNCRWGKLIYKVWRPRVRSSRVFVPLVQF